MTEDVSLPEAWFTNFSHYSGQKWGGGSGSPGRKLQQMENSTVLVVDGPPRIASPPHLPLWTGDGPSAP